MIIIKNVDEKVKLPETQSKDRKFSVNYNIVNKQPNGNNKEYLAVGFEQTEGFDNLVKAVTQGYSTMAGLLPSKTTRRKKINVIGSWAVFLDIDEKMSLSEALSHEFIKNHCSLIYTSASHQKEKNGKVCDRFRLVFQLSELITDVALYEQLVKLLIEAFPNSDKACKDASRIFFGNTEAEIHLFNENATLPVEWIEKAQQTIKEEQEKLEQLKLEKERQRLERQHRKLTNNYDGNYSSWEIFFDKFELPASITVDLRDLLGQTYQDFLTLGAPQGERNNSGFALAKEIIAVEKYLNSVNQSYCGDIHSLMSDYAIASGLSQREINQIINSAQRYDKNPSVNHFTDDGIKSKIASLVWKSLPNSQKYSDLPTSEITKEEFEKRRLLEELADITKDLNQRLHKGFSKTAKTVAEVKNDKIIFNTNFERFSTAIAHAAEHDYKFILDSTEAGGGKSFEYGKIASSDETDTIIWLSNDHNNPSTETVKNNFVNVPPRTLENCHRANEFIVLSEKNINVYSEDKSENPICATCERLNQCKHFCGNGYGFLAQRKDAYSHKKIRQHPLQLPSPKQYDYSKTIFGIDEAEALLNPVKTINGYYTDLVLLMDDIEGKNPELYQSLQPLKSALKELLQNANDEPKYGFSDAQIREKLPQLPEEIAKLIDEYKTIISYDINQTVENIDYNQNFENLEEFQEIKQRTNEETARVASARLKALKGLPNNILLPFLEVLSGQRNGALRIQKGKLTVTIKDDRVSEILKTAKLVFLLDATADKSQLAKFLNISPDDILEIQQKPQPKDNLTIHNIQMEGLGSRHRSADCLQRIDKIKQQLLEIDPNAKFIGTKQSQWTDKNNKIRYKGDITKEETQTHGYYGRDHRGTNKFKGCQNLALFSLPFTNVGDAEAECLTLYGSLDNFEHYYHLKIKKEIKQTIARPRVQWHKDKEFNLYIFATGFDASWITDELGIRVVNSHVFDFCPEAGSISQRAKWQLIQVIKQLAQTGENIKNITQGLVGEILGKSQQAIQKVTRTFKGGFKGLVNHIKQKYNSPYLNNNRDGCNFNPELDDLFREWLNLDPIEAVQEFIDIIVNQGWEAFKAYINQVSGEIKYRIIGLLTPIFAPEISKVILDSGG